MFLVTMPQMLMDFGWINQFLRENALGKSFVIGVDNVWENNDCTSITRN